MNMVRRTHAKKNARGLALALLVLLATLSLHCGRPVTPDGGVGSCKVDSDCDDGMHCACPVAGVAGDDGNMRCAGESACYPQGRGPAARP